MSETPPQPTNPDVQVVDEWSTLQTDPDNSELVSDSYSIDPSRIDASTGEVDHIGINNEASENDLAVAKMRAKALNSPGYHHAATVAAEAAVNEPRGKNFVKQKVPSPGSRPQTGGVNENLQAVLEVRTPRGLREPINASTPELSAADVAEFKRLMGAIADIGADRLGYRNADKQAQAQIDRGQQGFAGQENRYWEGHPGFPKIPRTKESKGRPEVPPTPSMRDRLASALVAKLEENPRYNALLDEHAVELGVMSRSSENDTHGARRSMAEKEMLAVRTTAAHGDPVNQERLAKLKGGDPEHQFQVNSRRHQSPHNRLPDLGSRYANSDLNGLARLSVKIAGTGLRAIAEVRATRRKERVLEQDKAEWTVGNGGQGVRDPHNTKSGYVKSIAAPGSANYVSELAGRRATDELAAADARSKFETTKYLDEETKMRQETFVDIVEAARNRLAGKTLMEAYGTPEEIQNNIEATLSTSFENFLTNDMLSQEDDYALFVQLSAMTEYIDRIDETLEGIDQQRQRVSTLQLAEMRANMVELTNRARYRREQLRIATASNLGADFEDGYFGQYGSMYNSDKSIVTEPNGVVLYDDGSYYDPRISPQATRNPKGEIAEARRNTLLELAPLSHTGEPLPDLSNEFESRLRQWFNTQSTDDFVVDETLEYAQAVIEASQAIIDDGTADGTTIDAAFIAMNKAQYWEEYISQLSGVSSVDPITGVSEVGVAHDSAIDYTDTEFYGVRGHWRTKPDGSAERIDTSGNVVESYAPNGDPVAV